MLYACLILSIHQTKLRMFDKYFFLSDTNDDNTLIYVQTINKLFALVNKKLLMGIIGLHAGGFALGYIVSKLGGAGEKKARAISIETGKFQLHLIILSHVIQSILFLLQLSS